jgi:hypothetical protein
MAYWKLPPDQIQQFIEKRGFDPAELTPYDKEELCQSAKGILRVALEDCQDPKLAHMLEALINNADRGEDEDTIILNIMMPIVIETFGYHMDPGGLAERLEELDGE